VRATSHTVTHCEICLSSPEHLFPEFLTWWISYFLTSLQLFNGKQTVSAAWNKALTMSVAFH
jgi:hypothetical protein